MYSDLTYTVVNSAVSKRVDQFDYTNKNIRRITVQAHMEGEVVGTLVGYLLDIQSAYNMDRFSLSEVTDLLQIDGEIGSLCSFLYGALPSGLHTHFKKRQRVFNSPFRKLASKLGYQRPERIDLIFNQDDFKCRVLYISRVCVDSRLRGQGVGSALIQQLDGLRNKVDYLALMSFPYENEYETGRSERYARDQEKLDGFYKRLGFLHADGTRWMVQTPQRLLLNNPKRACA